MVVKETRVAKSWQFRYKGVVTGRFEFWEGADSEVRRFLECGFFRQRSRFYEVKSERIEESEPTLIVAHSPFSDAMQLALSVFI